MGGSSAFVVLKFARAAKERNGDLLPNYAFLLVLHAFNVLAFATFLRSALVGGWRVDQLYEGVGAGHFYSDMTVYEFYVFLYGTLVLATAGFLLASTTLRRLFSKAGGGGGGGAGDNAAGKLALKGVSRATSVERRDLQRKFTHLLGYALLWVGVLTARAYFLINFPELRADQPARIWGYDAGDPGFNLRSLALFSEPSALLDLGIGQTFSILLFHMCLFVVVVLEAGRLSERLHLPGQELLLPLLREKEVDSLASYLHFFECIAAASFLLPPAPLLAVMGVCGVGDALASQFGMRWGRRRVGINSKKTWLGTAAGTAGSFSVALLTVGPAWAAAAAGAFFLTDVLTERPVNLSDNLLTGTLISLAFVALSLAGVHYTPPAFVGG